jgi:hypothetical protein
MNKNQKGLAPILILAIIAVVIAGYFFFVQKSNLTTSNTQYQPIENADDLTAADNELNNADTNQVDIELNQLSFDASAF